MPVLITKHLTLIAARCVTHLGPVTPAINTALSTTLTSLNWKREENYEL